VFIYAYKNVAFAKKIVGHAIFIKGYRRRVRKKFGKHWSMESITATSIALTNLKTSPSHLLRQIILNYIRCSKTWGTSTTIRGTFANLKEYI